MSASPRGPYRSPIRRAGDVRRFVLQERDLDILAAVLEHRFVSKQLLLWLFPPDAARTPTKAITAALAKRANVTGNDVNCTGAYIGSNLERRLRALFHGGLLDRVSRGVGRPFAYSITSPGQRMLRTYGRVQHRLDGPGVAESLFYVEHALMIARFRIAIGRAVAEHPSLEARLSLREGRALRASWRERGERYSVNPDAYIVLADRAAPEGRNARAFFIECDRGTMTLDRLLRKFESYVRFETSGELTRHFGVKTARIVTVTETATRASALLNLAAGDASELIAPMRDRFLFTTEETYREQPTNILAAIWRGADQPAERRALIPSPLPLARARNAS